MSDMKAAQKLNLIEKKGSCELRAGKTKKTYRSGIGNSETQKK